MLIPRLHLFELEDLAWFPRILRDYATDYLQFVEHRLRFHEPVTPLLADLIRETGERTIIDLCSGGAGPMLALREALKELDLDVRIVLTDKYPNLGAFKRAHELSGGAIDFIEEPIDARDVPSDLRGIRTVFNAFHHFAPKDAAAIIKGAVDARQPIAIFEIPERKLLMILSVLVAPIMVLLVTPFIRPFRWRRLLLTYIIPLIPLVCLWDGVVSQLRAYTPDELEHIARKCSPTTTWRTGKVAVHGAPVRMTYLIGCARDEAY